MAVVARLQTTADMASSQLANAQAQLVPTGTVFHFAGNVAPAGWLFCDGSSISRTTYSALFAVISTTYGSADANSFNLPNTQGIFISGTGSQTVAGITYTRTHGSPQGDQMQGHDHGLPTPYVSGATAAYVPTISTASNYFESTSKQTSGFTAGTRSGTETRPANVAMRQIIKT